MAYLVNCGLGCTIQSLTSNIVIVGSAISDRDTGGANYTSYCLCSVTSMCYRTSCKITVVLPMYVCVCATITSKTILPFPVCQVAYLLTFVI